MRNRIVFRPSAAVAMQPSSALHHSVSPAFNLEASLADKTTMQIMTATQHGQAARLPQMKEQTQVNGLSSLPAHPLKQYETRLTSF